MQNIQEARFSVLPAHDAAVGSIPMAPGLLPLRQVVHDLQHVDYWLTTADGLQTQVTQEQETITKEGEDPAPPNLKAPTLLSLEDRINFIKYSLERAATDFWSFKEGGPFHPAVKEHLDQAYYKMMTAYFNSRISEQYYRNI